MMSGMADMRALALLALLPLAACAAQAPDGPRGPRLPPEDSCGAAQLQGLIGQKASVLETMRFAGPVRVIKPGMAVTMDHSPMRLNISLDADGTIIRLSCG